MADVNPILVGMELSGRFIEIIIDLMEKYPEEWKFSPGADQVMSAINNRPLVEHSSGVKVAIHFGDMSVQMDEATTWEASIYAPVYLPANQKERQKLGEACKKMAKILILKALNYERLLKENSVNIDKSGN